MKNQGRKEQKNRRAQLAAISQLPFGQKTFLRQQVCAQILEVAVGVVDGPKSAAWHSHALTFYPECMLLSDL